MRRRSSKKPVEDTHQQQLELRITELDRKARELQEFPKLMYQAKLESEMTIPPCPDLAERERQKRHLEQIITRGEVENTVREHNRSLLLLFLLAACTVSLIWWATRLMNGI